MPAAHELIEASDAGATGQPRLRKLELLVNPLSGHVGPGAWEEAEQIVREGWNAGVDGSIFYEAWGFLMQNQEGCATQRGIGRNAMQRASETLRELQKGA